MDQAISGQHPAVMPRSQFNRLRALLAIAMIAVAGLTAALVAVAGDDDRGLRAPGPANGTLTKRSAPALFDPNSIKSPPGVRYDGGPEEGTRVPAAR